MNMKDKVVTIIIQILFLVENDDLKE